MIGSYKAQLGYELTNIELDYELILSQKLADEARSNYTNGKRLMYEYVTCLKNTSTAKATDTIIGAGQQQDMVKNVKEGVKYFTGHDSLNNSSCL